MLKCLNRKKLHSYFHSEPGFDPRTSKIMHFSGLTPWLPRPRFCVVICVIMISVIQSNFFHETSNLCHKNAHAFSYNLFTCICTTTYGLQHISPERHGNGIWQSYDLGKKYLLSKLQISEVGNFFSSWWQHFF